LLAEEEGEKKCLEVLGKNVSNTLENIWICKFIFIFAASQPAHWRVSGVLIGKDVY
jgi:hypothetical protein